MYGVFLCAKVLTVKQELYDKLYEAYGSLEYTEKIMLTQHLGFCPECFSTHYADRNDLDKNGKPKKKPRCQITVKCYPSAGL